MYECNLCGCDCNSLVAETKYQGHYYFADDQFAEDGICLACCLSNMDAAEASSSADASDFLCSRGLENLL